MNSISAGVDFLEQLLLTFKHRTENTNDATKQRDIRLLEKLSEEAALQGVIAFLAFTDYACLDKAMIDQLEVLNKDRHALHQKAKLANFLSSLLEALKEKLAEKNRVAQEATQRAHLLEEAAQKCIDERSEEIKIEEKRIDKSESVFHEIKKALDKDNPIPAIDKLRNAELALYTKIKTSPRTREDARTTIGLELKIKAHSFTQLQRTERAEEADIKLSLSKLDEQIERLLKDPIYQLSTRQFDSRQENMKFPKTAGDYAFIKLGKLLDARRKIADLGKHNCLTSQELIAI